MKLPPSWRLMRVKEVGHVQAGRQRSPIITKGRTLADRRCKLSWQHEHLMSVDEVYRKIQTLKLQHGEFSNEGRVANS